MDVKQNNQLNTIHKNMIIYKHKMNLNTHKTIGIFTSSLGGTFNSYFLLGVSDVACELNYNLITFTGGPIEAESNTLKKRNVIYDLVDTSLVDGLIVPTSTLSRFVSPEKFSDFLKQFNNIPILSFGCPFEDYPFVKPDYSLGIQIVMSHLIEVHGCSRIAFLRGTENNINSIERFNSYLKSLDNYGLKYDPKLHIFNDILDIQTGIDAIHTLMDERKVQFDAILTINDPVAIGTMKELQSRGINIPGDVAIASFQGMIDSIFTEPPLTTVYEDTYKHACVATRLLIKKIEGEIIPKENIFAPKIIIRKSCGCTENFGEQNNNESSEKQIISEHKYIRQQGNIIEPHFPQNTLGKFNAELISQENNANSNHRSNNDENSMDIQRSLIINKEYEISKFISFFRILSATLTSSLNISIIKKNLSELFNVEFFHISLYEGDKPPFKKARLMSEYQEDINELKLGELFDIKKIIPDTVKKPGKRYSSVIMPLFLNDIHLGYLYMNLGSRNCRMYEILRDQISNALILRYQIIALRSAEQSLKRMNASLGEMVHERTKELENSLHILKETQNQLLISEKMAAMGSLVVGISHEINTPVGVGITAASYLGLESDSILEKVENESITKSELIQYLNRVNESKGLILKNLNRAAFIVKNFKQISVDQASDQKRIFFLLEYLEQILSSLRPEIIKNKVDVSLQCQNTIKLNSYPGAFYQIITNLFMNSITHGFENTKECKININAFIVDDKTLYLEHKDNGRGIPSNEINKIFDPFFTTRRGKGGTGLGLNIVYNIVTQKLNGTIKCDSILNKGTTFTISIPADTPIIKDNK